MLTQESSRFESWTANPPMAGFFYGDGMRDSSAAGDTVMVNGRPYPCTPDMTVASLLADLPGTPGMVVVELNGSIIPRETFDTTPLAVGDNLEVVHFVGGG